MTNFLLQRPCIHRTFQGGSETINLREFINFIIQEEDLACQIAHQLLDNPQPYTYNEDDPEFYETFTISDREALQMQLDALEKEYRELSAIEEDFFSGLGFEQQET